MDKLKGSKFAKHVVSPLVLAASLCGCGSGNSSSSSDYCTDGECVVTLYHPELDELTFGDEDRNKNGISDLGDWANDISVGCRLMMSTGECVKFNPSNYAESAKIWTSEIERTRVDGIHNEVSDYYYMGGMVYFLNIPDMNMDSLVFNALNYERD